MRVSVRVKVRLRELDRRVGDDVEGRRSLPRTREEAMRCKGKHARRAARLERGGVKVSVAIASMAIVLNGFRLL